MNVATGCFKGAVLRSSLLLNIAAAASANEDGRLLRRAFLSGGCLLAYMQFMLLTSLFSFLGVP